MITIETLSKSYRKHRVLNQVQLDIPKGKVFALLGPNGSGKTTLLKSLLGIVHPMKGSKISFNGKSILGKNSYKKDCGYMPQFPRFLPHLKVCELVELFEKL
ncbi:MAG: ATP-binding cassette domain-containing protein, partial [Deltaproteobacteria bacterium]|nr:ATP-binding cassette domain-containing protein [Deltaproteobacteria bacterium]